MGTLRQLRAAGCVAAGGVLFACANLDGLAGGGLPDLNDLDDGGARDGQVVSVDGGGPVSVGGLTITPSTIDFASAPCGSKQTTPLTLKNTSATDASFTLALPPAGVFALTGADATGTVTGTLAAGAQRSVTLTAAASAPWTASADVVVVVDGVATTLDVTLETEGALLSWIPSMIDFGQVREEVGSVPISAVLRNDGSQPATIDAFGISNAADFNVPLNAVVATGTDTPLQFSMTAADTTAPINDAVTPEPQTTGCVAPPTLQLKGQRTDADVFVNPGTVYVGSVGCGQTDAPGGLVTISNYSTVAAPWNATLASGSKFAIDATSGTAPASSGISPASSNVNVKLASPVTAPGDFSEPLAVVSGLTNVNVTLTATIMGAVVSLDATATTVAAGKMTSIPIRNTGNETICVAYAVGASSFILEADQRDMLVPGDASQAISVGYSGTGPDISEVIVSAVPCFGAGAPPAVCSPLPTLTVQGAR